LETLATREYKQTRNSESKDFGMSRIENDFGTEDKQVDFGSTLTQRSPAI
jgi:hypothetical protein